MNSSAETEHSSPEEKTYSVEIEYLPPMEKPYTYPENNCSEDHSATLIRGVHGMVLMSETKITGKNACLLHTMLNSLKQTDIKDEALPENYFEKEYNWFLIDGKTYRLCSQTLSLVNGIKGEGVFLELDDVTLKYLSDLKSFAQKDYFSGEYKDGKLYFRQRFDVENSYSLHIKKVSIDMKSYATITFEALSTRDLNIVVSVTTDKTSYDCIWAYDSKVVSLKANKPQTFKLKVSTDPSETFSHDFSIYAFEHDTHDYTEYSGYYFELPGYSKLLK
jgi:hypothetical protein